MDIRLSKSQSWINATGVSRKWYAPGVGPVKMTDTFTVDGYTLTVVEELTGHFSLLAEDLAPANSDSEYPGKPSVGYDGTNFLVVSREVASQTDSVLTGMIVNPSGKVLKRFEIGEGDTEWTLSSNRSAVAFDGDNYLVVFAKNGQIVGQRVSPSGQTLDGATGFTITSSGTNYFPAVDFDGTNFLVVWAKFTNGYDIYGVLVSPQGEVQEEFPVFVEDGEQVTPSIAFNGSNYLVAWRDTRWDGAQNLVDIYATRISPSGVPLDPSGLPLCVAAGDQDAPALVSDGNDYFAVWADGRTFAGENGQIPGLDIYGARVAANGSVLDPAGIPINTVSYMAFNGKANPTVAFDGDDYFVAWQTGSFPNYPPAGIFASWVTTAGDVQTTSSGEDGLSMSGAPTASARYVYPVAGSGEGHLLLTWVNLTELSGESKDLYGVVVRE